VEHPGRVYLGLGSNLGDRGGNLHDAIEALRREPGFVYLNRASIYRTPALGPNAGDEFQNTVVAGLWSGSPDSLLDLCHRIEDRGGRDRPYRWAPRTLDIDILFWDGVEVNTPRLRIPHPDLCQRAFALVPLLELAPNLFGADGCALGASLTGELLDQGIEAASTEACRV
jgi:2-amino-4-hydroxy-6-hydroxymethyldihydropteridine diphosphokinase